MVLGITKIIILAYLQMSKKGVVYTYLIFIFQKIICESQSYFPMLFCKDWRKNEYCVLEYDFW